MNNITGISNIDKLGAIKAEIAQLTAQAKQIEKELKESGVGRYSGAYFDALVYSQERETTDWKAVAEKLEPSRQLVTAHTSVATSLVMKVSARKAA